MASALVFSYYLLSLRIRESNLSAALGRLDWTFGCASVALFALAVIVVFVLVESPFRARLRRFDDRRIADLKQIEEAIRRRVVEHQDRKAQMKRPLPRDLDEIATFVSEDEHRTRLNILDPQTSKKYGYTVKGESTFELCAEFSLDDRNQDNSWNHPAGQHCFTIDILKGLRAGYP